MRQWIESLPGERFFAMESLEHRRLFSAVSASTPALDPRWQQADIGAVGLPGDGSSARVKGQGLTFSLEGSGAIGGVADAFHFVYQTIFGNGGIVVRLDSQTGSTDPGAQVGLMLRESLLPGARMVALGVTAAGSP